MRPPQTEMVLCILTIWKWTALSLAMTALDTPLETFSSFAVPATGLKAKGIWGISLADYGREVCLANQIGPRS